MNNREMFFRYLGQTSPSPMALEIVRAEGCYLYDASGKSYLDLIGGISVCNLGHRHHKVVDAIQEQLQQYLHIMVYGELVQSPQTRYAQALVEKLPEQLDSVFFTASGAEATEGAMKLAKRYTGRWQLVSFKNSYHGSTQGALSVMGSEYWQQAFRPLLPGITQARYNDFDSLDFITQQTACVIAETIQAEAGVLAPSTEWMQALRKKCTATGTLLVLDEIQCGFGRNGTLWAFEQFNIEPDIVLLGKALGGGMPLGAFVSNKAIVGTLSHDPVLGHINTFGGHPVSCAAGLAAWQVLHSEKIVEQVADKEKQFLNKLIHPSIRKITSRGLMMALHFENAEINKQVIDRLLQKGVFTDWFLFAPECLRIAPPLTISYTEIEYACRQILSVLDEMGS